MVFARRFQLVLLLLISGGLWLTACGQNAGEPTRTATGPNEATAPTVVSTDASQPAQRDIILATTTSTQDSGLLDVLIPVFEEQTGYVVKVIAVGTGQALTMGQQGNADVLLVHAPSSEKELMDDGSALDRRLIMHNDFVIVGPPDDPAGIKGLTSPAEAFSRIADAQAPFVSRGDDSGTHKKELSIWQQTGMMPEGEWYLQSGQGMGATLRIATEKGAYTLSDRATYLALRDTLDLDILVEGDPTLLNVYHVMSVNSDRFENINAEGARAWSDFLTSEPGQTLIANFGVEQFGQPLFFPDADKTDADLGLD